MTLLEMQRQIKRIKKSGQDVNPAILTIYKKALREANKVIKDELGDVDTWNINWRMDDNG